jgi:two-component system, response regulator PdtaR
VRLTRSSLSPPHRVVSQPARPRPVFARDNIRGTATETGREGGILIVEDDFLIAAQIEATLKKAGFEVTGIASSAAEALEHAISDHPLLCVMDIRLSGDRDGVDAALELFRAHGIRSIFATAHSDSEVLRRAAPADPLGWLQKPYTMSALVHMVRQAVNDLRGVH